jgi:23S rRNA (cytosine1962-C5)-methyltransferase
MPTHAPQEDPIATDVVSVLMRQLETDYLGVHQRLDADTSGVMIFARRREANASLAEDFAGRGVRKHYVALVHGIPTPASGIIDLPLSAVPGGLQTVAAADDPKARHAVTRYATRWTTSDGSHSLVDLFPETGRTHQLRVHFAAVGTPIVGDPFYDETRPFPRLMLHAHALELRHPGTAEPLRLVAPLPVGFGRDEVRAGAIDVELALRLALARRAPLANDPATTAYLLVNGDGDGLSGVMIERMGDLALVDAPRCPEIETALAVALPEVSPIPLLEERTIPPSRERRTIVAEIAGVRFIETESNGLFQALTHRESIERMSRWSEGKHVLACGTIGSGITLAALSTCADLVVVERQRWMLEWLRRCIDVAHLRERSPGIVVGALHEQLERFARRGRRFDVVAVDLRAALSGAPKGEKSIGRIAAVAVSLTETTGLAILFNDNPRITRRAYRWKVTSALESAGIEADIVALYGASPIDAPVVAGEESPLKVMVVRRR